MSNVVSGHPLGFKLLMIAVRRIGGPTYPEMIEEMERELHKIIEDFGLAVNVEALRLANETSKLAFSESVNRRSSELWCRAGRANRARTSRARACGASARRASARRARIAVQAS